MEEERKVADMLCEDINFNELQDAFVLDLLVEDKNAVEELVKDKEFPMTSEGVKNFLEELKKEDVIKGGWEIEEKSYSKEEVINLVQQIAKNMREQIINN